MRWSDRLIGLLSTLILARLLVPEDFGIVAMASIVVGLIDVLLDLGVHVALIHAKAPTREDYDTAWTLRLLQAGVSATLIVLLTPLAVDYFGDGRVGPVLYVMAFSVLLGSAENIGIVDFQKHMRFGQDFRFFFLRRLAGFLVTVAMALWLRSYWAMVVGALSGRMVGVLLSYRMHEFRPRLSLARARQLWSFSQWVLVRNIGAYVATRVDKFVVGNHGPAGMGSYALADEIAAMPTSELLAPLGRVLFPAFVEKRDRGDDLLRGFSLALGVQSLLAIPAGVGLAMVAPQAVPLLLGEAWTMTIPLIQILALVNVVGAVTHSSIYLLLAQGRVKALAAIAWMEPALFLILALAFARLGDLAGIAQIRLGAVSAGAVLFFVLVQRWTPGLTAGALLAQIWRPALAAAGMAAALHALPPLALPLAVHLLARIAIGAAVYAVLMLMLWRAARLPDGAERYCLQKIRILWAGLIKRYSTQ
ncbi:lipopolysaccharide biosynthesis protein [Denitromonas sp. IR12]|uniref:Lipopolysaccharide biosynthesis protein n=2 Tax=Denitromonas iodatirespirans TaxID=2795389 RepID=A0A944H6X0_DENI1|nr:lipopolysaccharide biosynthesis protein [Denitromonas iodatirespirans]